MMDNVNRNFINELIAIEQAPPPQLYICSEKNYSAAQQVLNIFSCHIDMIINTKTIIEDEVT